MEKHPHFASAETSPELPHPAPVGHILQLVCSKSQHSGQEARQALDDINNLVSEVRGKAELVWKSAADMGGFPAYLDIESATRGRGPSLDSDCKTSLIGGRFCASGLQQAKLTISSLFISSLSYAPSSLVSAAHSNLPSVCRCHTTCAALLLLTCKNVEPESGKTPYAARVKNRGQYKQGCVIRAMSGVLSSFPGFFGASKCLDCSGASSSRRLELRRLNITCSINSTPSGHGGGLFDRQHEVTYLKQFMKRPGRILLLVGPQDCGKSAILQKVADDVGRDQIIMLDLRVSEIASPLGFLKVLGDALATSFKDSGFLVAWHKFWEGIKGRCKVETPAIAGFKAEFELMHVEFQIVIRDFLKQRAAAGKPPPTLVIDEANVLQGWLSDKDHRKTLSSYMRFFLLITKQEDLANVVLVSSDFFFKFWLNEEIRATRYIAHVIGDFPEAEARSFFEHILGRECSDEMWNAVYSVYGGSAYLLKMAARSFELSDYAWKEEAVQFYLQVMSEVEMGLSPECLNPKAVPASWTQEQYCLILNTMVVYPLGVTPWKVLCKLAGVGQEILKALICHNLLQYRTSSTLAKDLVWYKGSTPVVMPLSRLHWLAMLELVQKGRGIIRDEEIDFQHVVTLQSSQNMLILPAPDEEQSK